MPRLLGQALAAAELTARVRATLRRHADLARQPPQLRRHRTANLAVSRLSSPIPPELGQLTDAPFVRLEGNRLSGPIPPELGQLTNVRFFSLDRNQLSDSIAAELGRLTNLSGLRINDNQLSGTIPLALGDLAGLTELLIDGDTGLCLPPAIQGRRSDGWRSTTASPSATRRGR